MLNKPYHHIDEMTITAGKKFQHVCVKILSMYLALISKLYDETVDCKFRFFRYLHMV